MKQLPLLLRQIVVALFVIGLAACQYEDSDVQLADYDYRAKFPIRVESDLVQANFVGTEAGTLSLDELVQLDMMVSDYLANGQKPILIVMPGSALEYSNLASEIQRRALEHSLAKSEVLVGVDPQAAMNGQVTVSYLVHTAIAPDCGYYQEESWNYDNINSSNFGCSTQRNLAAMIANPGDLVASRTFTTRDAQRTANIIQAYQSGENPQASWPTAGGDAALDVASDN
ncbi:MAG: CpaD family pilus assembly lipoprotein [Pseudomonadota bacterium]